MEQYTVVNGIIQSLGKFENEPVYAPHFWSMGLEGFADSDNGRIYRFKLTADDKAAWPELKGRRWLSLWEDEQGFVHCR